MSIRITTQTVLEPNSVKGFKKPLEPTDTKVINTNPVFNCPFCLYIGTLREFYVKTKHGYSKKRAKCPDCRNLMRMDTLTRHISVEDYATWVYYYAMSGFWQKCPFDKFKHRLYALGMSRQFWDRYKELKGGEKEYE